MLGDSVLRGDAVIRTMMWVVTRHMHRRGVYVCGVYSFKFLFCMIILGWAEMSFLQVH